MKIRTLIFGLLFCSSNVAWAMHVIDKIEEISRSPSLATEQKINGRNTLFLIVANCEYDEACLLKQVVPLKELFEKERNPMYIDFAEFLSKNQDALERDSKRCNFEDKKVVRKAMGQCYKEVSKDLNKASSLTERAILDKQEDDLDVCVKAHMEKLAENGNIFAQAVLVNLYQQMSDEKKMDYWYNQIQKQSGTKKYQDFQSCSEIP